MAAAADTKRVLMVVSNYTELPQTEEQKKDSVTPHKTGWYLPEAAHPWTVFKEKGYSMTWVSPSGGLADCDESSIQFFLDSDAECKQFANECLNDKHQLDTKTIAEVADADKYDVIFYVGGHGTMWDFPECAAQNKAAAQIYENGGIVSAVCHGPAGLVGIQLSDGQPLVAGKTVTGFTNDEEDEMKLTEVMPFKLESVLKEKGAKFSCVKNWLPNVEVADRLITGQNPNSAGPAAKAIVAALSK